MSDRPNALIDFFEMAARGEKLPAVVPILDKGNPGLSLVGFNPEAPKAKPMIYSDDEMDRAAAGVFALRDLGDVVQRRCNGVHVRR